MSYENNVKSVNATYLFRLFVIQLILKLKKIKPRPQIILFCVNTLSPPFSFFKYPNDLPENSPGLDHE